MCQNIFFQNWTEFLFENLPLRKEGVNEQYFSAGRVKIPTERINNNLISHKPYPHLAAKKSLRPGENFSIARGGFLGKIVLRIGPKIIFSQGPNKIKIKYGRKV